MDAFFAFFLGEKEAFLMHERAEIGHVALLLFSHGNFKVQNQEKAILYRGFSTLNGCSLFPF